MIWRGSRLLLLLVVVTTSSSGILERELRDLKSILRRGLFLFVFLRKQVLTSKTFIINSSSTPVQLCSIYDTWYV